MTEIVLKFSPPPFGLTTRKGPRPYFSILPTKLMLNLYVLTVILAYQHAALRLKLSYARYLGLWAPKATKQPPQSTTAASTHEEL